MLAIGTRAADGARSLVLGPAMRSLVIAVAMIMGWIVPALAESANGTTIPVATQIVDSDGAIWTLRLSGRVVLKDGVEAGASGVLELWYLDHAVWGYFGGGWWRRLDQRQTSGQALAWPAK